LFNFVQKSRGQVLKITIDSTKVMSATSQNDSLPEYLACGEACVERALERAKGIEPSYAAWEAAVLPLNYARLSLASLD
jgi:hypothetical protein